MAKSLIPKKLAGSRISANRWNYYMNLVSQQRGGSERVVQPANWRYQSSKENGLVGKRQRLGKQRGNNWVLGL